MTKPLDLQDTEFVRERTYRADLGLIQFSDGETAWLVDPLALDSLEPVNAVLNDPSILKVLHSGSEDLEVLLHTLGVVPEPLIDTQIACAMLGQPLQLAYHNALSWLFDLEIAKDQTRSNWCRRPLRSDQLRYAAMDVVLLPEMLAELRPRLEALGRWAWLQEDVARMQRQARQQADPGEAYLRFASAARLDPETLQALRYLARWREETAQARNRARGFVVSDAVLLRLARERPDSLQELKNTEDIHPAVVSRHGDFLLNLLKQARADRTEVRVPKPLDDRERRSLKSLRRIVQAKAAELGIDPALLASRRELENLLRAQAREEIPERFAGWRRAVVTDDLLAALRA